MRDIGKRIDTQKKNLNKNIFTFKNLTYSGVQNENTSLEYVSCIHKRNVLLVSS